MTENKFSDNADESRYELNIDGKIVFADYRRQNGKVFIDHVEAPQELRGTGAAGKLMHSIMGDIQAKNMKAVPICGYAASWLRKHNEYSAALG